MSAFSPSFSDIVVCFHLANTLQLADAIANGRFLPVMRYEKTQMYLWVQIRSKAHVT
jgi:hypothetical protein